MKILKEFRDDFVFSGTRHSQVTPPGSESLLGENLGSIQGFNKYPISPSLLKKRGDGAPPTQQSLSK